MINQYIGNYDVEIVNKMTFLLYSETWTRLITWLHCLDCEIKIWNNTIVWNGRCTCMTSIVICLSTLIHVYQGKCWPDTLRVTSLPCRWSCLKLVWNTPFTCMTTQEKGGRGNSTYQIKSCKMFRHTCNVFIMISGHLWPFWKLWK